MGYLKYVRKLWEKPGKSMPEMMHQRLILWRQEPSTLRLDHPTRIDRARSLGFKAKPGYIIVRQRLQKRRRMRPNTEGGRRPKHARRKMVLAQPYQWVAEQRAQQHYPNCEVLNSYFLAKDGKFVWFEVILVDKHHPQILASPEMKWIANPQHKNRVFRGLTSAGKKTRGLLHKGKGAEKLRPSRTANTNRKMSRHEKNNKFY